MAKHITLLAGITVFFIAVVVFSYLYGPMRRSFVSTTKVLLVESTEQTAQAWETSGVKGRITICFTRYLNALEEKESKNVKVTELSMQKGIIRRVFHITPDNAWPEISGALSKRNDMRPTPDGFIGLFDYGRVYIMPLSRSPLIEEKALIIVEPRVWSHEELLQIVDKLRTGRISSDLVIIIRGSDKDAELFRQTLPMAR
jgi:hypothetical protein